MQEILVILVLALIFLGPKKLPELASGIGKAIREVRKATADIKSEIELDDVIRKPLEELREATMLPPEELKRRDEERKWRAQREKEEAEARARGEDPNAASAEANADYHEPGDGYDQEHNDASYDHSYEDPNSHAVVRLYMLGNTWAAHGVLRRRIPKPAMPVAMARWGLVTVGYFLWWICLWRVVGTHGQKRRWAGHLMGAITMLCLVCAALPVVGPLLEG